MYIKLILKDATQSIIHEEKVDLVLYDEENKHHEYHIKTNINKANQIIDKFNNQHEIFILSQKKGKNKAVVNMNGITKIIQHYEDYELLIYQRTMTVCKQHEETLSIIKSQLHKHEHDEQEASLKNEESEELIKGYKENKIEDENKGSNNEIYGNEEQREYLIDIFNDVTDTHLYTEAMTIDEVKSIIKKIMIVKDNNDSILLLLSLTILIARLKKEIHGEYSYNDLLRLLKDKETFCKELKQLSESDEVNSLINAKFLYNNLIYPDAINDDEFNRFSNVFYSLKEG